MSKKMDCNLRVIAPLFPLPIILLSISLIGVTSAAVPVKNASSAIYISSLVKRSSLTSIPISFAMVIMLCLVMPSRIEVRGVVFNTPSLTINMFSPLPSETYPSVSRSKASSYPQDIASFLQVVNLHSNRIPCRATCLNSHDSL